MIDIHLLVYAGTLTVFIGWAFVVGILCVLAFAAQATVAGITKERRTHQPQPEYADDVHGGSCSVTSLTPGNGKRQRCLSLMIQPCRARPGGGEPHRLPAPGVLPGGGWSSTARPPNAPVRRVVQRGRRGLPWPFSCSRPSLRKRAPPRNPKMTAGA
ncbi:hypothetical protein J2S89_002925 [Arthrobacter bambusae]|nr:hypothetical protein [Arthrobacter bambusae]MDQ0098786.1 hypothetical protein [Arthrobacter bambusae]